MRAAAAQTVSGLSLANWAIKQALCFADFFGLYAENENHGFFLNDKKKDKSKNYTFRYERL